MSLWLCLWIGGADEVAAKRRINTLKAQKNLLIKYNKPTNSNNNNDHRFVISYFFFTLNWNYTTILSYLFILNAKIALMAMICCNHSNTNWKKRSTIIGTFCHKRGINWNFVRFIHSISIKSRCGCLLSAQISFDFIDACQTVFFSLSWNWLLFYKNESSLTSDSIIFQLWPNMVLNSEVKTAHCMWRVQKKINQLTIWFRATATQFTCVCVRVCVLLRSEWHSNRKNFQIKWAHPIDGYRKPNSCYCLFFPQSRLSYQIGS